MRPEWFDVTQRGYLNLWDLNGLMWHRERIFKPMIPKWFDVTQREEILIYDTEWFDVTQRGDI